MVSGKKTVTVFFFNLQKKIHNCSLPQRPERRLFNTRVKNPVLEIGDQVKVLDHMQTVMHMQEGHGSYTEAMELILGRTGHVINYRPFVGCKVEFQLVGEYSFYFTINLSF